MEEPDPMSAKDSILKIVRAASYELARAYNIAVAANQLSGDVPILKELNMVSRRLGEMLREISQLRGLEHPEGASGRGSHDAR